MDRIFDKQPVTVTEGSEDQHGEVVVVENGEILAASPVDEVLRSLLLVNSDVYTTGSRTLADSELPDVLKALEEVPFRMHGYPESDSEKLLLIGVSRAIERRAFEAGEGTLHVGFQQLSRLVEEPGTYRVYEQLSETDLDIHAYGVADVPLPEALDLTLHSGRSRLHRRGWFVVFRPVAADDRPAGVFSTEREPNRWDGFWTFDSERVTEITRLIRDVTTTQTTEEKDSRNAT